MRQDSIKCKGNQFCECKHCEAAKNGFYHTPSISERCANARLLRCPPNNPFEILDKENLKDDTHIR